MFFFKALSSFRVIAFANAAITLSIPHLVIAEAPYNGSTSVFVNYANAAENPDLTLSPTIRISFNGSNQHVPFIMDTGSVGIVASPDIFQPAPGAKNLGKGRQIYSSSGIIEEGTWWSATQNIYDSNGTLVATSNVPVLQVIKIKCTDDARDCTPNNNPQGISVMGIGFARESKTQVRGTPPYNAFLNLQTLLQGGILKPLPADWVNGYVVTPTGVDLGLTATNTLNAGWVKLMPWTQYSTPDLPEWMPAPMTININGQAGNGNVLMDTGVGTGYLTPPSNADLGTLVTCPGSTLVECAPDGNNIGVYLPNQTNPIAFYNFTVGESGNLTEPNGVHVDSGSNVFFNTSRHVLGAINFVYDNTSGYIGYIWNGLSGDNVGYVIPAVIETTTALSSSSSPSAFGKKVTFTATVTSNNPSDLPSGVVTFHVDHKIKKVVELDDNGAASFSISTLPPVKHLIEARYSGDNTFIRSKTTLMQVVKPPTCF